MRTFTFITYSPATIYAPVIAEVRGNLGANTARVTRHLSRFARSREWIVQEIHQLEAPDAAAARDWFVSYIADLPRRGLACEAGYDENPGEGYAYRDYPGQG